MQHSSDSYLGLNTLQESCNLFIPISLMVLDANWAVSHMVCSNHVKRKRI